MILEPATHYIYINKKNELHPDFRTHRMFKPKEIVNIAEASLHLPEGYFMVTGLPRQLMDVYEIKLKYNEPEGEGDGI